MIFNKKHNKYLLLLISLLFIALLGSSGSSKSLEYGSCTVKVICSDKGSVSCTSDANDCERDAFGGTVTCDGITTSCD